MQEEHSRQKQECHALQVFQGDSEIGIMWGRVEEFELGPGGSTEVF